MTPEVRQEARDRLSDATRLARRAANDTDPHVAIDRLSDAVERLAQALNRVLLADDD